MMLRPIHTSAITPAPGQHPKKWQHASWWLRLAAFCLVVLGLQAVTAHKPTASAQTGLIAYQMIDQWPQRDMAAKGLFQSPSDLDVSFDGTVFVADPGIGGVNSLLPSGVFTTPFGVTGGFPAQLGRVGPIALGPNPPPPGFVPPPGGLPPVPIFGERVYVLDTATDRVVIYSTDGQFVAAWDKIKGQSIAASMDGRVYVLDRDTSQVRALDSATGAERFVFGQRGLDDGQFANFTDVDVTPDSRVLVVGDKRGQRVQLFDLATDADLAGANPPPPAKLRTVYDLRAAQFTLQGNTCDGSRVNALGDNKVFIGEGVSACVVDGRKVTFAIAASANRGAICRDTVTLPRLKAINQKYYALAVSNPNAGKCGEKRTELDTTPVVVKYSDEELRQVDTIWEAASNQDAANPLLFAPEALSMPQDGVVFVSDSSSQFRFFNPTGKQVATAQRSSQVGNFSSDFQFFYLIRADGTDVLGEVVGYYINGKRSGGNFVIEGGIGRFRTVDKPTRTGIEKAIEPIWTDPLVSSFEAIEVPALAWNPVTKELLVVRNDTVASQRTQDVKIIRYLPDGRKAGAFDLPDDGQSNPYVAMSVGSDGRIFALDDLNDLVRIYQPDGTFVANVPVAFDARAVAGGPVSPDGSVFVLREPGSIERYADDGTITARLDGRPLPFSDSTTLTDLVVDKNGLVYVSDGQASLISVFKATDDRTVIPIPNDAECLFNGQAMASPPQIPLGATTTVTFTLDGKCGIDEAPADIVVVVPYFRKIQPGVDPSAAYITEMTQMMSRVNFGKHRVGIVSYYNTVKVELPLTGDRAAYIQAVRNITRFDPPNQNVKAHLRDAMDAANKLYDRPSTRRKVMVLLRAEYCTPDNAIVPGQCTGMPPAEGIAQQIRDGGTTIIVVNSFGAFDLASSDEDAMFGVENVHRRMVRYAPPLIMGTNLTLGDEIPGTMVVDPTGMSAGGVWQAPRVTWQMPKVDFGRWTFSVRLTPQAGGTWPTSLKAVADFVDGWGKSQSVVFPIPDVVVVAPTPAPTRTASPTATPTLVPTALPTVAPTATPKPRPVYLPIAYVSRCKDEFVPIDAVLVIDVSSSMNTPAESGAPTGGRTKLQAALDAAAIFVAGRRPDDRVAVVAFDQAARLAVDLTGAFGQVQSALDNLSTGHGSRIDLGLKAAAQTLTAAARPGATPVIVLLTDGHASSNVADVHAEAARARSAGIAVYAIGLGSDADRKLLLDVAGDPSRYLDAPDAQQLAAMYDALGAQMVMVCR